MKTFRYFIAGLTCFYNLFTPLTIHAQNHKKDEIELREALLQLPSDMPSGISWNRANLDCIKTDTLTNKLLNPPDTTLVRTFYLTPSPLQGISPDSTQAIIVYIDKQPLWHPNERDVLEIMLSHTRKAEQDTSNQNNLNRQNWPYSILKSFRLKARLSQAYSQKSQSSPDTTITEWYRSIGLNGWYPGEYPLDPRDKGSVIIRIGNSEINIKPTTSRYTQIQGALLELFTFPPDTTETNKGTINQ